MMAKKVRRNPAAAASAETAVPSLEFGEDENGGEEEERMTLREARKRSVKTADTKILYEKKAPRPFIGRVGLPPAILPDSETAC